MNTKQWPGQPAGPGNQFPKPGVFINPEIISDGVPASPVWQEIPFVFPEDAEVLAVPEEIPGAGESNEPYRQTEHLAAGESPPGDRRLLVIAIVALAVLVLVVLGSRLALEFVRLRALSPLLGWSYLAALLLVVLCLGLCAWRSWRRYQRVLDITKLRELVTALGRVPCEPGLDDRLRHEWQDYLAELERHADESTRAGIALVRNRFEEYSDDATRDLVILEEYLLEKLDARADWIIELRAAQTAISTALASRLFDSLIVTWQCLGLVGELSRLYSGRPGVWGTVRLFRRGMAMLVFVELADLAKTALVDALAQKALQALGARMIEGTANGLVMLRFGEAVRQQCRPAPLARPAANSVARLSKALFTGGLKSPQTEAVPS